MRTIIELCEVVMNKEKRLEFLGKPLAKGDLFVAGIKSFIDSSHSNANHISLFDHKRPIIFEQDTRIWRYKNK